MTDAATKARAMARTAPLIREAGGDPDALRPVIDEYVNDEPNAAPEEILAVARAQVPEAFQKAEKAKEEPPTTDLSNMTESKRMDYVEKHGVAAYTKLVKRDSEKRVAEMRRKRRGF